MHELSIVQSMMELIQESAAANRVRRVTKVKLVVGQLTLAQPDLLQFAFATLAPETIFEGAVLEIEERPLVMRCRQCGETFKPEYIQYACPSCGGRCEVVSGKELYVDFYEGDTEEEEEEEHGDKSGNGATAAPCQ
ncbi:hydrogenase nickel insertion protein HypA [Ammonifex degensii KC4]|uniref:Hydrogenase maturation factor HypA n=1 Tax=Ammonifex degensii (strain DSM 10501 / KC4) TaxID=429009 RepID=C9R9W0_AMMDK|nr:hydrogenase maturation nickel metallochaperone HypA [Ammonifex degensii]ACX53089.1 hydrogenase nickel insertion protein HypA [Ammonifex degensii KC4]